MLDIGSIEFIITYADKTKEKHMFWLPGYSFVDLFHIIRKLVPETEYMPEVLLLTEDFEKDGVGFQERRKEHVFRIE